MLEDPDFPVQPAQLLTFRGGQLAGQTMSGVGHAPPAPAPQGLLRDLQVTRQLRDRLPLVWVSSTALAGNASG